MITHEYMNQYFLKIRGLIKTLVLQLAQFLSEVEMLFMRNLQINDKQMDMLLSIVILSSQACISQAMWTMLSMLLSTQIFQELEKLERSIMSIEILFLSMDHTDGVVLHTPKSPQSQMQYGGISQELSQIKQISYQLLQVKLLSRILMSSQISQIYPKITSSVETPHEAGQSKSFLQHKHALL